MRRHLSPRQLLAALVAVGVLTATPARAQDDGPIKQHLPNGLRVVAQGNEHTATVVIAALVRITALHEPSGATGIRQLTQTVLASGQGCHDEMLAAAVRADGQVAPDYVELSIAAPAESLEDAIGLLRRLLFRPELSEEAVEMTRAGLVRSFAARGEIPVPLAVDRLYEALYPGIGSGDTAAGDPVEVDAITLDDIRSFHARHYLPNATVLGISGGIDAREAVALVEREMGRLLPGALPREAPLPSPGRPPGAEELEIGGNTSVYAMGGRAVALDSPVYPAMAAGVALLGSGMDCRLYRALRLERSLAYTIGAELTPSKTAPSGLVVVACDPEQLDEVARVVEGEIERAVEEPAGADELQRAKRYLIGKHALRRQRNREIAHYLAMFELLGGPQGYRRDAQLAGEIAAVDANAVMGAIRELFRPAWAVRLRACETGAN